MDWDDLRFVLAIARAGTLSGAARKLAVDQTTVGRRLTALENRLGARLFLRTRSGFRLTEAGETALVHTEVMESAVMTLAEKVRGELRSPTGLVRIASMPWIFNYLLVPALPSFVRRYPGVEVHAVADLRERSLSNREAELALRFEMQPWGSERSYEIAAVPYALYAPKGTNAEALPWIGTAVDFALTAPEKWANTMTEDGTERMCFRSNDAGIMYRAVCARVGKGLLPEILGENDPALVRLSGPKPEIVRQLRILVHPDVERYARVGAVIGWLRETLAVTRKTPDTSGPGI